MATSLTSITSVVRPSTSCRTIFRTLHTSTRSQAAATLRTREPSDTLPPVEKPLADTRHSTSTPTSPLARLPTTSLLRGIFLSTFFTSPLLFKPALAVFKAIANSKSSLLNPDKNPILRSIIRPVIYDQFCAGRNEAEIAKTSQAIKDLGFSGVVLCYGKEVQINAKGELYGYEGRSTSLQAEVQEWRDGYFKTLKMVREGDWLGIKMTGAGIHVTKALVAGQPAPPEFVAAMDEVCEQARSQGCWIWIDAEQQILQPAIDAWTFELMRKHNRGHALVYNTVQAYLKSGRAKIQKQLDTASREGWMSAIKLVRGAYMANDDRAKIHDTKTNTDDCYNSIVTDLLNGKSFEVFERNPNLQHKLLLAGHNTETVRGAAQLATELAAKDQLKVVPLFAQLQGMADDIGCELVALGESAANKNIPKSQQFIPHVYKCLTWGSIQECMQYLYRRLVENRGAADRMHEGAVALKHELRRRMFRLS